MFNDGLRVAIDYRVGCVDLVPAATRAGDALRTQDVGNHLGGHPRQDRAVPRLAPRSVTDEDPPS
jgi:hypothetical protein